MASTDIQATKELDELIDEQWPAFTGTYRIVEFDPQTGRTGRSHRETIDFVSMTDWELRSDQDRREWVRDGQHCTDYTGSGSTSEWLRHAASGGMCDNETMGSTSEQAQRAPQTDGRAAGDDAEGSEGSQRAMIRMLLRQTPEERLRGLVNAARFFANARRD